MKDSLTVLILQTFFEILLCIPLLALTLVHWKPVGANLNRIDSEETLMVAFEDRRLFARSLNARCQWQY